MNERTPEILLKDPELEARLDDGLQAVEERLKEAVSTEDRLIEDASTHVMSAGGKRLRPLLTLLTGQLGDPDPDQLVDAAAVVELTHLASLYHDDVMDSAPVRRGVSAAHEVYGNSVAILVGDMLFARASTIVASLGPEAVLVQAETFSRLCSGQIHETLGPEVGVDPIEHHLRVLSDKTASLIATSAWFGARLAAAPDDVVSALVRYGERVGVAFQLADDIIDLASNSQTTGKTPGTDLRERVPTMPVLLLEKQAGDDLAAGMKDTPSQLLARDIAGDLSDDRALASVVARLNAHPVMTQAREIASGWARDAVEELTIVPEGPIRNALVDFASMFVRRMA